MKRVIIVKVFLNNVQIVDVICKQNTLMKKNQKEVLMG